MFSFVLDNASGLLRKIGDVVKEITNDQKVTFEIDDRGLVLQAMDLARVCVLSLYLGPTCFKKFETDRSVVCLSISMLLKVLKSSAVDSAPELEMSWDGRSDCVTLRTPSQIDPTLSMATFDLPLFHAGESDRFDLPEPEQRLLFDASVFATTMKDLALFSDTATFEIIAPPDGAVEMKVSVSNATGVRGSLWLPAKTDKTTTSADGAKATFALSYLTSMVKAAALSETLAIELQRDRPLTMEVALLSGRGYLRMYLAPKVDEGDEDGGDSDC
jgi:proliferating cell nuclear antigen PCNA